MTHQSHVREKTAGSGRHGDQDMTIHVCEYTPPQYMQSRHEGRTGNVHKWTGRTHRAGEQTGYWTGQGMAGLTAHKHHKRSKGQNQQDNRKSQQITPHRWNRPNTGHEKEPGTSTRLQRDQGRWRHKTGKAEQGTGSGAKAKSENREHLGSLP